MCLKSANYATMVLREVLKMDTSIKTHRNLNDYHDKEKSTTVTPCTTSNVTEEEVLVKNDSLLDNPEKFEQFKNLIFNTNEPLKRQNDGEDENATASKKAKKAEQEDGDAKIKLQPSLV